MASGAVFLLYLALLAFGLYIQYLLMRAAVWHGLARFLQEASREEPRHDHPVPRRVDSLVAHLAKITRRPPEE
jgi:hypothetical protein